MLVRVRVRVCMNVRVCVSVGVHACMYGGMCVVYAGMSA